MPRLRPPLRPTLVAASLVAALLVFAPAAPAKEFLTPGEIAKIQDAPEVDRRVKIYLDAAELRLKTGEERLAGKESSPGDPLEFFTVEDMIEGYYHILRSVMFTLDEAAQRPREPDLLVRALKNLKDRTEKDLKSLGILKSTAEQKQKEALWKLVNEAIDIAEGAHEGAETGLARFRSKDKTKEKPKRSARP
jgi:hypothetical protein